MTLESSRKYRDNMTEEEYKRYIAGEVRMHDGKAGRRRDVVVYRSVAENMLPLITDGQKLLCLGTRNSHEKECFTELLKEKHIKVVDQDIAPGANADYTCDFNSLSQHLPNKEFDLLYTNSVDHAISAENAINDWAKVMRPGGLMFIALELTSVGDNCQFTHDGALAFFGNNPRFDLVTTFVVQLSSHTHYVLKVK